MTCPNCGYNDPESLENQIIKLLGKKKLNEFYAKLEKVRDVLA